MIDIGITKMMMVGAVALIVIGPQKLPRVARTLGTLLRNAQRDMSSDFSKQWDEATGDTTPSSTLASDYSVTPVYQHPKKNWRLKRGATPQWYKTRNGVRTKALSGAARVARYRPAKPR